MLAENHEVVLSEVDYVSRFDGNRAYGRFGWQVKLQDVNNDGFSDLVLGLPYLTEDVYKPNGGKN